MPRSIHGFAASHHEPGLTLFVTHYARLLHAFISRSLGVPVKYPRRVVEAAVMSKDPVYLHGRLCIWCGVTQQRLLAPRKEVTKFR
jgi:hypothetical protein